MATKYIAYCRKSTDEKDKQVLSIDSQISELKEFAKRERLEIVDFVTESRTAKVPGREKFEKVMAMIESGKANGILGWHPTDWPGTVSMVAKSSIYWILANF